MKRKRKRVSLDSMAVVRLAVLYELGRNAGYWKDAKECTQANDMAEGVLENQLHGKGSDGDVQTSITILEKTLPAANLKAMEGLHPLLQYVHCLFEKGTVRKEWVSMVECATTIGIKGQQTFTHLLASKEASLKLQGIAKKIIRRLESYLFDGKKGAGSILSLKPSLKKLYESGVPHAWSGIYMCAEEIIHCYGATLSRLLKADPKSLGPRSRVFYRRIWHKLKAALDKTPKAEGVPSKDDVLQAHGPPEIPPKALPTKEVPSKGKPRRPDAAAVNVEALSALPQKELYAIVEALLEKLLPEMLERLLQKFLPKPEDIAAQIIQRLGHKPTGIIDSPLYDRLLAGVAEGRDQHVDGVRFVLTRNSFRKLKGSVTKEEIDDTVMLMQELIRRVNIFAQLTEERARGLCFTSLGRESDELTLSFLLAQHVLPMKAIGDIERMRAAYQK